MQVQETGVQTDRVLTVPNLLSLLRLIGIPVFLWLLLVQKDDGWAALLLVASSFTDYLDGVIARRTRQISRLGQLLDPLADRLYVVATLLGLAARGVIPWWLVVVLFAREVLLASTLPVLRRHGYGPLPVHYLGKAATFNLLAAFPLVLLGTGAGFWAEVARVFGWAFLLWGTALYWCAGLLYVWQVRRIVQSGRVEEGSPA